MKGSTLQRVWSTYGLSITLAALFLLSWSLQFITQWQVFVQDASMHGEEPRFSEFLVDFTQATMENWQSEFLQLFTMVILTSFLIHRGSPQSKDGTDRMEEKIDSIQRTLEAMKTKR